VRVNLYGQGKVAVLMVNPIVVRFGFIYQAIAYNESYPFERCPFKEASFNNLPF